MFYLLFHFIFFIAELNLKLALLVAHVGGIKGEGTRVKGENEENLLLMGP